jgi:hypothetical protein
LDIPKPCRTHRRYDDKAANAISDCFAHIEYPYGLAASSKHNWLS